MKNFLKKYTRTIQFHINTNGFLVTLKSDILFQENSLKTDKVTQARI